MSRVTFAELDAMLLRVSDSSSTYAAMADSLLARVRKDGIDCGHLDEENAPEPPDDEPLFDVPERCPKCGRSDISLLWREATDPWPHRVCEDSCPPGQHMHWHCRGCQYGQLLTPTVR